jgi:hypothetical protein
MAETATPRPTKRQGKEGNRWVNERPSGDDLGEWFKENVEVAEGMKHEDYVGGVVLIPNKEKTEELVGWNSLNAPVFADFYDLVLTPYIRVETRVKYFQDLCAHEEWLGVIEPVEFDDDERAAKGLPPGFFRYQVYTGPETAVVYLGCSMRVTVFARDSVKLVKLVVDKRTGEERLVYEGKTQITAVASKGVPLLNSKGDPDANALMKAETGAVGRVLGMAGMLVIPGTGIATAEDMQEARQIQAAEERGAAFAGAELPPDEGAPPGGGDDIEPAVVAETASNDAQLRGQAAELIAAMKALPDEMATFRAFKEWTDSRGFTRLSEVTSPALRGLVRRAEVMLEEGRLKATPPDPEAAAPSDPLEA